MRDALFYGAPASDDAFIIEARKQGRLVRGWDFGPSDDATTPLANYPATNAPLDKRYQDMLNANDAAE